MRRNQMQVKKRVKIALFIFFIIIFGTFLIKSGKYIPALFQLFFQKEINLKASSQNRINVLLLGIGGGSHEGPNLTDTIIFASIDQKSKKVNLVSIPRDLWMPELSAKINTAYPVGESKQKQGGIKLAAASIEHLFDTSVDYVVRIDFDGFVKAVDMVGGLEITVDNVLDDEEYPLTGRENETCGHSEDEIASISAQIATGSASIAEEFSCRFEHLHFDKGTQKMDGETALKFVRSRHAKGGEGSDFARSKRQEKVIAAFKDRVFSLNTILNPVKLVSLVGVLSGSIDTNIKEDEYDDFIKLANKLKGAKLDSAVLDIGDESANRFGLLTNPPISEEYENQYVLIPRAGNGNYSEIQNYINCETKHGNCIVSEDDILTPTPEIDKATKKN